MSVCKAEFAGFTCTTTSGHAVCLQVVPGGKIPLLAAGGIAAAVIAHELVGTITTALS